MHWLISLHILVVVNCVFGVSVRCLHQTSARCARIASAIRTASATLTARRRLSGDGISTGAGATCCVVQQPLLFGSTGYLAHALITTSCTATTHIFEITYIVYNRSHGVSQHGQHRVEIDLMINNVPRILLRNTTTARPFILFFFVVAFTPPLSPAKHISPPQLYRQQKHVFYPLDSRLSYFSLLM